MAQGGGRGCRWIYDMAGRLSRGASSAATGARKSSRPKRRKRGWERVLLLELCSKRRPPARNSPLAMPRGSAPANAIAGRSALFGMIVVGGGAAVSLDLLCGDHCRMGEVCRMLARRAQSAGRADALRVRATGQKLVLKGGKEKARALMVDQSSGPQASRYRKIVIWIHWIRHLVIMQVYIAHVPPRP